MKNKNPIGILALLIIAGAIVISNYVFKEDETTVPESEVVIGDQAALVTFAPVAGATAITYPGQEGRTVLEILVENEEVDTVDSDFGEYVDSINGIKGGTDGKYWIFYVNDEMASEGAAVYETKDTDVIEWRFE